VGIVITEFWQPLTGIGFTIKNVPDSDWVVMRVPSAQGGDIVPYAPLNVQGYYFVNKEYAHPEALVIALNHFVEGYNNPEAAFPTAWGTMSNEPRYEGVMLHSFLPIFMDNPTKNYNMSLHIKAALDAQDPSDLNVSEKDLYDKILAGGDDNWPWAMIYLESVPAASTYASIRYNDFLGAPTKEMATYGATLSTLEGKAFTEILAGVKPLDAFDEFVAEYLQQGGQQVLDSIAGS